MKHPYRWYPIAGVLMILCVMACKVQEVARVGNQVITAPQFEHHLFSNVGDIEKYSTPALLRDQLNQYLDRKIKLVDAYHADIDKDERLQGRLGYFETEVVYNYTMGKEVYGKAIPNSFLETKYKKLLKEFKIRHILVYADSNNLEELLAARGRLVSVREQIIRGERFAAMARLYSQDSTTCWKGGALGYIKFNDYDLGEVFYDALFHLHAGVISVPIRSNFGLHLVWMEDMRDSRLPPFKYLRDQIRSSYIPIMGQEVDRYYSNLVDQAKKEIPIRFNRKNIELLINKIKQMRRQKAHEQSNPIGRSLSEILRKEDQKRELYKLGHFSNTIEQFLANAGQQHPIHSPIFDETKTLTEFLSQSISEKEYIMQWGYRKGYDERSEVREIMNRLKEDEMVMEIEKRRIHDLIQKPTDQEMYVYYINHREKYLSSRLFTVQEIMIKDEDLAGVIAQEAKTRKDLRRLANRYSTVKGVSYRTLGLSENEKELISRHAGRMKMGEVSDLIQTDAYYAIIKMLNVQPGKPLEFSKVNSQVALDIRLSLIDSLRNRWLNELKKNIDIRIDDHALEQFGKKFFF